MSESSWVTIGRFGRPYGVRGAITIRSFTEPADNILNYPTLYGWIENQWKQLEIVSIDCPSQKIRVCLKDYSTRETVAALTNVPIAVPRGELPELPKGEYYCHDLHGMRVINQQQIVLGTVIDIMPTGSNDVLVIEGEKRHLVPYLLEEVIIGVDLNQRTITVDWDPNF